MGGRGEQQNLDDFAAVSREILQSWPAVFGKNFREKLWAPIIWL